MAKGEEPTEIRISPQRKSEIDAFFNKRNDTEGAQVPVVDTVGRKLQQQPTATTGSVPQEPAVPAQTNTETDNSAEAATPYSIPTFRTPLSEQPKTDSLMTDIDARVDAVADELSRQYEEDEKARRVEADGKSLWQQAIVGASKADEGMRMSNAVEESARRRQATGADRIIKDVMTFNDEQKAQLNTAIAEQVASDRDYQDAKSELEDVIKSVGADKPQVSDKDAAEIMKSLTPEQRKAAEAEIERVQAEIARATNVFNIVSQDVAKRVSNKVNNDIVSRIIDRLATRNMPKSDMEYIGKAIYNNSIAGMLYETAVKAASGSSWVDYAVSAKGLERYDASTAAKVAGGVGALLADSGIFSILSMGGGAAAGAITNLATRIVAGRIAQGATTTLAKGALQQTAKRIATSQAITRLASNVIAQSATLGSYDAASSILQQNLANPEGIDWVEVLKRAGTGAASGAAVGGIGVATQAVKGLPRMDALKAKGLPMDIAIGSLGLLAENAAFVGIGSLASGEDADLQSFAEGLATLGILKGVGMLKSGMRNPSNRVRTFAERTLSDLRFTPEEEAAFRKAGIAENGLSIIRSAVEHAGDTTTTAESSESVRDTYNEVMASKEIPLSAKVKLQYIVTGQVQNVPDVVKMDIAEPAEEGRPFTVNSYDSRGRLLSVSEFADRKAAQAYINKYNSLVERNSIAQYEQMVNGVSNLVAVDRAARRYAAEHNADAQEIFNDILIAKGIVKGELPSDERLVRAAEVENMARNSGRDFLRDIVRRVAVRNEASSQEVMQAMNVKPYLRTEKEKRLVADYVKEIKGFVGRPVDIRPPKPNATARIEAGTPTEAEPAPDVAPQNPQTPPRPSVDDAMRAQIEDSVRSLSKLNSDEIVSVNISSSPFGSGTAVVREGYVILDENGDIDHALSDSTVVVEFEDGRRATVSIDDIDEVTYQGDVTDMVNRAVERQVLAMQMLGNIDTYLGNGQSVAVRLIDGTEGVISGIDEYENYIFTTTDEQGNAIAMPLTGAEIVDIRPIETPTEKPQSEQGTKDVANVAQEQVATPSVEETGQSQAVEPEYDEDFPPLTDADFAPVIDYDTVKWAELSPKDWTDTMRLYASQNSENPDAMVVRSARSYYNNSKSKVANADKRIATKDKEIEKLRAGLDRAANPQETIKQSKRIQKAQEERNALVRSKDAIAKEMAQYEYALREYGIDVQAEEALLRKQAALQQERAELVEADADLERTNDELALQEMKTIVNTEQNRKKVYDLYVARGVTPEQAGLRQAILWDIATGNVRLRWEDGQTPSGAKTKGLASELGLGGSASDKRAYKGIVSRDGMSVDEYVHSLWEQRGGYTNDLDDMEMKNEVLDVLQGAPNGSRALEQLYEMLGIAADREEGFGQSKADIERRIKDVDARIADNQQAIMEFNKRVNDVIGGLETKFKKKETPEPTNSSTDVDSNLNGKSDDTATRQGSNVSIDKDSDNSVSKQERGENVATQDVNSSAAHLSQAEANELLSKMEDNAEIAQEIELNPQNWIQQFGEEGLVETPIGTVKMGANQLPKLFEKGRSEQFGMIKPTLENPQIIIEIPSNAIDGSQERDSSLLFVKTFLGKNGQKIYYFKSVTVKKDGLEVSVSNHLDKPKRIREELEKGKLKYRFDGGAQTEHYPANVSVSVSPENVQGKQEENAIWRTPKDTTTFSTEKQGLDYAQPNEVETAAKGSGITPQIASSESKDSNNPAEKQENVEILPTDTYGHQANENIPPLLDWAKQQGENFEVDSTSPLTDYDELVIASKDGIIISQIEPEYPTEDGRTYAGYYPAQLSYREDGKERFDYDKMEDLIERFNKLHKQTKAFTIGDNAIVFFKNIADARAFKAFAEQKPAQSSARTANVAPSKPAAPSNKIEDYGEVIKGARKDAMKELAKSVDNATLESLISLPFAKAFKRPDLRKAVDEGALREQDARFAEAVMATYLSTKKPKADTKKDKYRKAVWGKSKVEVWAEEAYKGVQLLKQLFEAEPAERDRIMAEAMAEHYTGVEAAKAHQERLKEWNPGKTFTGESYPINNVALFNEALGRLGNEVGTADIPVVGAMPNTSYDSYLLVRPNGETLFPTRTLRTFEDVVDEVVYLTKLNNADADTEHPRSAFKVQGLEPQKEVVGYSVSYFPTIKSTTIRREEFKTKEAADAFYAKISSKKGVMASEPHEMYRISGYGKYEIVFKNPITEEWVETGMTYESEGDASFAIDQERDALNKAVNDKLAQANEKTGKTKATEYIQVRSYFDSGKMKYGVVIADKYGPKKTAFGTMPYYFAEGFATRKEAEAALEKNRAEWEDFVKDIIRKRQEYVYFDGKNAPRVGKDYRGGKDVTEKDFAETFGFRGVQFGNWTNQNDRQAAVNNAYDSFMDLANIIGVSPRALSLNGELGIAFGSRGSGKANAHYESDNVVINLTKTRGAGSLAHEWWHALDNYFARQAKVPAGFVTSDKRLAMREQLRQAFDDLIDDVAKSDYNERSRERGTYWGSPIEETARLFEEWVVDEQAKRGERNHFLAEGIGNAEADYAEMNYLYYKTATEMSNESRKRQGQEPEKVMSFEEFKKTPMALAGFVYPSAEELRTLGEDVRAIFDTVQERVDEETGNVALFHRGDNSTTPPASVDADRWNAIVDMVKESVGAENVITNPEDVKAEYDRIMAGQKRVRERIVEDANSRFNEQLEQQIAGTLPQGHIYQLGTPSPILLSCGIPNLPIELAASRLSDKSMQENHPFDLPEIEGLVDAIQNPLAVFRSATRIGSNVILTELKHGDKSFVVAIQTNRRKGRITVNDIRSIHYRNTDMNIVNWINEGLADYIKPTFAQEWLEPTTKKLRSKPQYNSAEVRAQLKDVAKVVKEFENPKVEAENLRQCIVYHGSGADFEKFDHSHMGEGEGAQAYGWGTYVTEVNGIARSYANNSSGRSRLDSYFYKGHSAADIVGVNGQNIDIFKSAEGKKEYWAVRMVLFKMINGKTASQALSDAIDDTRSIYMSTYSSPAERKDAGEMNDVLIHLRTEDFEETAGDKNRNLYTVDIPDDNGQNYLKWNARIKGEQAKRILDWIENSPYKKAFDHEKHIYEQVGERFHPVEGRTGKDVYEFLKQIMYAPYAPEATGSADKRASQVLSEMGFVGISYPAQYRSGGRSDGARNYVIFNENDAQIVDHERYFRTPNGEVYGFTIGGRIYLDSSRMNAETPIHEYTELWSKVVAENNPELWRRGKELLKETDTWKEVNADKNYKDLSEDERASETLSRIVAKDAAKKISEISDNKTLVAKLRAWLRQFWKDLKATFSKWSKDDLSKLKVDEFTKMPLRDLVEKVDLSKYTKAKNWQARMAQDRAELNAVNAEREAIVSRAKADGTYMKAPNGKPTNLTERQWADVRTSRFKEWFGDWEKAAVANKLLQGESVAKLNGNEFAKDGTPLTTKVTQYYKDKFGGAVTREGLGEVILDERSVKDSMSHGIGRTKSAAFAAVPNIIKDGVVVDTQTNWKDRGYDSATIAAPVSIGGKDYIGLVVVKRSKEFNRFYLHEVFLKESLLNGDFQTGLNTGKPSGDIANVIKDIVSASKTASKVVDENGEPMVVYHGTAISFGKRKFDTFDTENAPSWFTPSKHYAEIYSKARKGKWRDRSTVYPVFLNIRNLKDVGFVNYGGSTAVSDFAEQTDIPIGDLRAINRENQGRIYGDGNATYDDSVYMLYELTNSPQFRDYLIGKGYDGIKTEENEEAYAVFSPNQIKSATDNVGTYDSRENDIRFMFAGEKGAVEADRVEEATTRMANLAVARKMEIDSKDAHTIKLATGWERGADGKWRYEIPDFDIDYSKFDVRNDEDFYVRKRPLKDVLTGADELFEMYPFLNKIKVRTPHGDSMQKLSGNYNGKTIIDLNGRFFGDETKRDDARATLMHEVQHVIQDIEGFALGGNPEMLEQQNRARIKELSERKSAIEREIANGTPESEYEDELADIDMELQDYNPDFGGYDHYRHLSGEVEARNVEKRMQMTPEERRASLAAETEDVAREDQIFLYDNLNATRSAYISEPAEQNTSVEDNGSQERTQVDALSAKIAALQAKARNRTQNVRELTAEVIRFVKDKANDEVLKNLGEQRFRSMMNGVQAAMMKIASDRITPERQRAEIRRQLDKIDTRITEASVKSNRDAIEKMLNLRVYKFNPMGVLMGNRISENTRQIFDIVQAGIANKSKSWNERENRYVYYYTLKEGQATTIEKLLGEIESQMYELPVEDNSVMHKIYAVQILQRYNNAITIHDAIDEINGNLNTAMANRSAAFRAKQEALDERNADKHAEKLLEWRRLGEEIVGLQGDLLNRTHLYNDALAEFRQGLESLIEQGRSAWLDAVQQEAEERMNLMRTAFSSIRVQGAIPYKEKEIGKDVAETKKNRNNELRTLVSNALPAVATFDSMLRAICINDIGNRYGLYDTIMGGEDGLVFASDKQYKNKQMMFSTVEDKIKELGLGKDINALIARSKKPTDMKIFNKGVPAREKHNGKIMRDGDGNIIFQMIELNVGELMYLYSSSRQEQGRKMLLNAGIDELQIDTIADYIADEFPKEKQFVDWVTDELLPAQRYERYNGLYEYLYKTQMPDTPHYFPLEVNKKQLYKAEEIGEEVTTLPTSTVGSIIARREHNYGLNLDTNFVDKLIEHINDMEHWYAFAKPIKQINTLLSSTQFRNVVEAQAKGAVSLLKRVANIAVGGNEPNQAGKLPKLLRAISRNDIAANITFRFNTALKQTLSYPAYFAYSASPRYWMYMAKAFNPKNIKANWVWAMNELPTVRERWESRSAGFDQFNANDIEVEYNRTVRKAVSAGMWANSAVDLLTCTVGARAIYEFEYSNNLKSGMSPKEADTDAKYRAALFLNQTQQSGDGIFLSRMQKTPVFSQLMAYRNANTGYARLEIHAVAEATRMLSGKTRKRLIDARKEYYKGQGMSDTAAEHKAKHDYWQNFLRAMMVIGVFGGLLPWAWQKGSKGILGYQPNKDDDDDDKDNGVFFIPGLSDMPIYGPAVDDIYRNSQTGFGLRNMKFISAPTLETIKNNGLILWDRWRNGEKADSYDKTALFVAFSLGARFGLAFDAKTFDNMYHGVAGIIRDKSLDYEDAMEMLNSPRSAVKAVVGPIREGETKEEYMQRLSFANRRIRSNDVLDKKIENLYFENLNNKLYKEMGISPSEVKALSERVKEVKKRLHLTGTGYVQEDYLDKYDNLPAAQSALVDSLGNRIYDIYYYDYDLNHAIEPDSTYKTNLKGKYEALKQLNEEYDKYIEQYGN